MAISTVHSGSNFVRGLKSGKADTSAKTDEKEVDEESEASQSQDLDTAAVYEKGNGKASDIDEKKIKQMLKENDDKVKSFKKLFQSLLEKQSATFYKAHPEDTLTKEGVSGHLKDILADMEVDEETVEQAKKDISEDGYFGVKKTSERILDFAKSLAGNDPEKLEKMYSAVEKGFKEAAKIWGGDLPEISQKTFEAVKKGFDDWREELGIGKSTDEFVAQAGVSAVAGSN